MSHAVHCFGEKFNCILLLEDGFSLFGSACGVKDFFVGELCFTTSMTGYQESLTDPSYTGQLLCFSFPHIGIVGTNDFDQEIPRQMSCSPLGAGGAIMGSACLEESFNWRAQGNLNSFLVTRGIVGMQGVDTRALIQHMRKGRPQQQAIISFEPDLGNLVNNAVDMDDVEITKKKSELLKKLNNNRMDCIHAQKNNATSSVSCQKSYTSSYTDVHTCIGASVSNILDLDISNNTDNNNTKKPKVVVIVDFGVKKSIQDRLRDEYFHIIVVPFNTSFQEILRFSPDGIVLSNGPGNPIDVFPHVKDLLDGVFSHLFKIPLLCICMGHQLMGLYLGAKTYALFQAHRGVNQPVYNKETGCTHITSMNHGYSVDASLLPANAYEIRVNLFDGSNSGFRLDDYPLISVQHHPEASPGPHDESGIFHDFAHLVHSYSCGCCNNQEMS